MILLFLKSLGFLLSRDLRNFLRRLGNLLRKKDWVRMMWKRQLNMFVKNEGCFGYKCFYFRHLLGGKFLFSNNF